jgi:hypothetical protein
MPTFQLKTNGQIIEIPNTTRWEVVMMMKELNIGGTITMVEDNPIKPTKVIVTCGYGNQTHKWETTKDQAVKFKNCCPEHRSK